MISFIKLKPAKPANIIYSQNQIVWGALSLILFFGTIIYLNLRGFVKDNKSSLIHSKTQATSIPTLNNTETELINLSIPKGVFLYPQLNTLSAYELKNGQNIVVATFSGQIQDLGKLKNDQLYIITGKNNDSYDEIWLQNNQQFEHIKTPSISTNILKPVLSSEGRYIYFITNAGSGKKSLMRLDLKTGLQQEIIEIGLPLTNFFVNSDNTLIGLIVELSNDNKVKNYVLGIVQTGAKNLNLFPNVVMKKESNILFNDDQSKIMLESATGIALFDIRTSKLTPLGVDGSLVSWYNQNRLIVARNPYSITSCRKGLTYITGYTQLEIYQNLGYALEKLTDDNLIQSINKLNFPHTKPFIWQNNYLGTAINIVDNLTCNEEVAYYNVSNNTAEVIKNIKIKDLPFVYVP
ncbi:hypothetical protein COX08_03825 [Candidatus Beckwithbacteria bacterium CG23_combo_of_CG06-09_8_20_14_all_34_8]|uniref:Uncharacterized protein n=1 Tax=Candidatus Beckwithbacteria bacterium CG23_combo_of_CG06-09_8_20_14_all_34_8 TaxID=1974497 RepID=A0A2H0B5M3_9BACT|nr:MAG: hypothetical protein COX08_03825 [Candidatus Beckwithbacteria bacterium CG23_combo_of_CG06-09_8_20_14_all_34_8]